MPCVATIQFISVSTLGKGHDGLPKASPKKGRKEQVKGLQEREIRSRQFMLDLNRGQIEDAGASGDPDTRHRGTG